jgi:hypothetical protein
MVEILTGQFTFRNFAATVKVSRELQIAGTLGPSTGLGEVLDSAHQLFVVASDQGHGLGVLEVEEGVAHAVLCHILKLGFEMKICIW